VYTAPPVRSAIRRRLFRWYDHCGRDLPWRRTRDPYAILVSEVMLQQTQVSRVLPAYASFLRRFPTLATLASAPLGDVLRAWSGLGYNRRARDLHRTAREARDGLPRDIAGLDALPGVGAYTAGAVSCFSSGARVVFADTNIRRVLGRLVLGRTATEAEAVAVDAELLPRDAARWHHALMDLGATLCRSRAPRCDACPVAASCRGRGTSGEPPLRKQSTFATSDRRVRGRIVASLRERETTSVATLRRELADERVPRLVRALVAEGLVRRQGLTVSLPGS